ncbi:AfsR/SARP family transcriptional regulator [Dactylosporangium salmoneum]|uniref:Transcriptional regulator AfsR n=1 Tax=Dactylosporangium salmoneum TaxID=53361 RepID=A0ABN3HBN5_9ACTN
MSAGVRFGLLGPLWITADEGRIDIPGARQRVLLAALLLRAGRPVGVSELQTIIWGDGGLRRSSGALHMTVARLRERLGGALRESLRHTAGGYMLDVDPSEVDTVQFEMAERLGDKALRAGEWAQAAAHFEGGLALWRGEPLADVPAPVLHDQLGHLPELRLRIVEGLHEARLRVGSFSESVGELQTLVLLYPFRERLHWLLMTALHAVGRRSEALEVYRIARAKLTDELGIDPGLELERLHRRILADDPDLARRSMPEPTVEHVPAAPEVGVPDVIPRQLPADIADFTGREQQVHQLRNLCEAQLHRTSVVVLSAVVGAGGIGKTSLAIHVGHSLRSRFPDGQLYASLRGMTTPARPVDILDQFVRALGGDPAAATDSEDATAARFRTLVADRRILIVLDDAADAAQVRPLLPGTTSCSVVVTSRHRLAGLDGVARIDLDVMSPADGLTMFERIVGTHAVAAEPESSWQVVRACGGLPLAIRMAAARLVAEPGWNIRTLADRLADRSQLLDELGVEDRAVRTTLAVGYQRLTAEQARAFALLGRWTGPDLSVEAAAALLHRTVAETDVILRDLTAVHLLDSPSPDRYTFHDLVRVYAAEQPVDGQTAAIRRLAGWYLHCAEAAMLYLRRSSLHLDLASIELGQSALRFADRVTAVAWLDLEHANLVAAVVCASGVGAADVAWQLPVVLGNYFLLRGRWSDWAQTCATGLAAARATGDLEGQCRVLNGLGNVLMQQGRLVDSVDCLREAIEISRAAGITSNEIGALSNLGYSYGEMGDFDSATEAHLAALKLNREAGDRYSEGNLLSNLARVAFLQHDFARAISRCEEAAAVFLAIGNNHSYAMALNNLGEIHSAAGHQPAALSHLSEALRRHRALDNRYMEAGTLINLGNALCMHGQTAEGHQHWQQALEVMESTDDPRTGTLRSALAHVTPQTRELTL